MLKKGQKVKCSVKKWPAFRFVFFKYKNNWKKVLCYSWDSTLREFIWGFVFVLSKAEFPVILAPLPCHWWIIILVSVPTPPSVRLLPKHVDGWIWGLWLLFSGRKGEGCCFCFSYAFVSTLSQSRIHNPTGKIWFRHNSGAARVCCKTDQLAKLCFFFYLDFAFFLGRRKTKKSPNQPQQVLPKWYFSYLCWFQGESKRMCNCFSLRLLGWRPSLWHYPLIWSR